MCIYMHRSAVPTEAREGAGSPRAGITGDYEPSNMGTKD